jgi:hypothetical protein
MEGLFDLFAKGRIEKWINAWNNQDLETVPLMFAEDVPRISFIHMMINIFA